AAGIPLSALAGCTSGGSRDPGTIRIAFQQFGSGTIKQDWISAAAQEFSQDHPELTVELVPRVASENDYFTKNELLMSSPRTSPDLVYEDSFILLSDMGADTSSRSPTWSRASSTGTTSPTPRRRPSPVRTGRCTASRSPPTPVPSGSSARCSPRPACPRTGSPAAGRTSSTPHGRS